MSNKKTLIISILTMLSIVILVVGGILFALNNKEKTMQENMKMIKSDYANFSNNITAMFTYIKFHNLYLLISILYIVI